MLKVVFVSVSQWKPLNLNAIWPLGSKNDRIFQRYLLDVERPVAIGQRSIDILWDQEAKCLEGQCTLDIAELVLNTVKIGMLIAL